MNTNNACDILWDYLTELRKELLESQKIRTQVIGFKITFVTALIGFFASKLLSDIEHGGEFNNLNYYLLVIPAIASLFFDFLIYSYSFSIKRIGSYIKFELEPILKEKCLESRIVLWQEYLDHSFNNQKLAKIGNLGLTIISVIIAIIPIVLLNTQMLLTILAIIIFSFLIGIDAWVMNSPNRLIKKVNKHYNCNAIADNGKNEDK